MNLHILFTVTINRDHLIMILKICYFVAALFLYAWYTLISILEELDCIKNCICEPNPPKKVLTDPKA